MEGDKIKTNILIAGKSGVGKSSLLNYIFGEEVSPTGAGKPVTAEGLHEYLFRYATAGVLNPTRRTNGTSR